MKKIGYCFFIILLFLSMSKEVFSQGKVQASYEYSEGKITIFYEFQGNRSKDYDVSIKLKRTSDSNFEISPAELSGDIGEGKFAGKKNKIIWVINEEESAQLEGEDFYFDVTALEIVEGEGIPWYYFAGGAALAGGTAAILLLGKNDSDGTTPTPPSNSFPTPPSRP
jgi:hypothetical protein